MTIEEIRDALGATEPDYPRLAAEFGTEGLTHLRNLVLSDDARVATKAVYLVAMIKDPLSVEILQAAAKLPNDRMRVAVGAAAADLDIMAAARILARLLKDGDAGVRGIAMRSVDGVEAIKKAIAKLKFLE